MSVSVFDLFTIRPVELAHRGPDAGGAALRERLEEAGLLDPGARVRVELFGSLDAMPRARPSGGEAPGLEPVVG